MTWSVVARRVGSSDVPPLGEPTRSVTAAASAAAQDVAARVIAQAQPAAGVVASASSIRRRRTISSTIRPSWSRITRNIPK